MKTRRLHLLRDISIKHRLILTFLATSIVPLIFISIYSFHLYSGSLKEKVSTSTSQMLSLVNTNMVTELEKYQYLCGAICINEKIQEALTMDNMTSGEKNRIVLNIQNIVKTQIIYPAQAKNITVLDSNGNIFYNLGYDGFYEDDLARILSDIEAKAQGDSWTYVRTYRFRDIIVLARRVLDRYDSSKVIGYTLISIDEKLFSKTVLQPVDLTEDSNILYMNADGTVLSSWDRSIPLGEPLENEDLFSGIQKLLPKKSDSFDMTLDGHRQLITYSYHKNLNQFFVSTIPFSYINSEANTIMKHIGIISLILLVFCITTIFLIYFSISSPINKMIKNCQKIAIGNLDSRIADGHHDELSYLSNSMDTMSEKIQHLMETLKKDEEHKRELELQMLQYQINPHFLFNTLNSLRFVASMNQDFVVSDGIKALSSLLKNTLVNKHEFISIWEEIENLKNYFSIQNIRYAGNFQVTYDLEEALSDCVIPKFILQPLAENSIMHGGSDDGTVMDILISCHLKDNSILLSLSDNGKGFDTNKMNQQVDLLVNKKWQNGIGVANVNQRIQLNFGKPYGLSITSQPGTGTTCNITLPMIRLNPEELQTR